jgi:hypothetical protein
MQLSRAVLAFFGGIMVAGCTGTIPSRSSADPGALGGAGGDGANGSNGGNGVAGSTGAGGKGAAAAGVGLAQWRRLSADQYIGIVKDVLGVDVARTVFVADTLTGQFATNIVPAQDIEVDRYATASETVADKVDAVVLAKCAAANRTCAEKFLSDVAPRLYRKPLAARESQALLKLFDLGNADGFKTGVSLMLRSMLQSPSFLYLVEFGERDEATGLQKLGPYEVAARLALVLWKSAPDAALLATAAAGELRTTDQIKQAAERMMKDPRFGLAVADFHLQLFRVNKLIREGAIAKASLGGFSAEIRQAMVDETTNFITDAVTQKQATIETMLSAKHAFPPKALLTFNNTPASLVKANGRVDYTDGKRAGLLTMSGFMTAEPPTPTDYGAVQRGKVVREDLLCQRLPPPPPGLNFKAPPDAATTPQRALLAQHQTDATCKNCHKLMDNIGFAFENYDAFGRYRTTYPRGETVDSSGLIEGETDVDGNFAGPEQLGAMLARSKDVRACIASHWFRYAVGREPTDEDEGSVATLTQSLTQGAGDIPTALLAFVQSTAFRFIKGVQ